MDKHRVPIYFRLWLSPELGRSPSLPLLRETYVQRRECISETLSLSLSLSSILPIDDAFAEIIIIIIIRTIIEGTKFRRDTKIKGKKGRR